MFSAYQPAMTLLFFRATPVGVYINSDQKKSQGPCERRQKNWEVKSISSPACQKSRLMAIFLV
jgi:hypothetical protein